MSPAEIELQDSGDTQPAQFWRFCCRKTVGALTY